MRATTVRFGEDLWEMLEREAAREGVSSAAFIRDATLLRVAYLAGKRGDEGIAASVAELAARSTRAGEPVLAGGLGGPERLAAIARTRLTDAPSDPALARLARLTSKALDVPISLISLVEEDRQFFAACVGVGEPWNTSRQTPLSHSFCQHAVASGRALVVNDAREHPVLRTNLAIRDMGVIAYAGIPLIDGAGFALGTLCAIDSKPREWSARDVEVLEDMAGWVTSILAERQAAA
jgi:GAF domain-containing protein